MRRGCCCCFRGELSCRFTHGFLGLAFGVLTPVCRYVAVHTIQESSVESTDEGGNGIGNGHSYSPVRAGKGRERHTEIRDTMLVVLGMMLPLLAQVGHAH